MNLKDVIDDANYCRYNSQAPVFDDNGNFAYGFGDKEVMVKVGNMYYPIKDHSFTIGTSNLGIICHLEVDTTKGVSFEEMYGDKEKE